MAHRPGYPGQLRLLIGRHSSARAGCAVAGDGQEVFRQVSRELDPGSGGPADDFTNRNTTDDLEPAARARLLKGAGGIAAQATSAPAGTLARDDFDNPDYCLTGI